jgi:hypothetical protein
VANAATCRFINTLIDFSVYPLGFPWHSVNKVNALVQFKDDHFQNHTKVGARKNSSQSDYLEM